MTNPTRSLATGLLITTLLSISGVLNASPIQAKATAIQKDTTVSIQIGGAAHYTIFGYTSPKASVSLQGIGISDQTIARDDGYFAFENQFSPFRSREACITAQDQFGRLTPPVCLPPFPVQYDVDIGPVIMPPTMSLDKPLYYISDEVVLTGQTIPNTDVTLSSFTKPKTFLLAAADSLDPLNTLIPVAQAYTIPTVETKADDKGNFSLLLPSSAANTYRIFAQTKYIAENSPKSLTLQLQIHPIWFIIISLLSRLFAVIASQLLNIIIGINGLFLLITFARWILKTMWPQHYYPLARRVYAPLMIMKRNALAKVSPPSAIDLYDLHDKDLLKRN